MDPATSLWQMCPYMICSWLFLILLNRSLLYVFVIVSSCCLIKCVTHLCFFSILRQLTRLCPCLFGCFLVEPSLELPAGKICCDNLAALRQ
jgi:hypothetical protein